jgi:ribosome-associated toxin RatA of RatAB toxin-antitoxin module
VRTLPLISRQLAPTPGGRRRVRQALLVAGWIACAATPLRATEAPDAQASVREEGGVYVVAATFNVSQSAVTAVEVLTDYEQIPRFMPDVRTSRVLERTDSLTVVEQEAVAKLMMFSKRIHLVLEVHQRPGEIRFRDRCGKSFARYEGVWTITESGGQTAIAYRLTAKPSFDVPEFLLKRLLKRDASQMIQRLQAEIVARALR